MSGNARCLLQASELVLGPSGRRPRALTAVSRIRPHRIIPAYQMCFKSQLLSNSNTAPETGAPPDRGVSLSFQLVRIALESMEAEIPMQPDAFTCSCVRPVIGFWQAPKPTPLMRRHRKRTTGIFPLRSHGDSALLRKTGVFPSWNCLDPHGGQRNRCRMLANQNRSSS